MSKSFIGTQEVNGPQVKGDPIRRYYFTSLDTPLHWHNEFEILFVRRGCVNYHIGEKEFTAYDGDIVLVSPYALHSGNIKGDNLSISVYVVKPDFICPKGTSEHIAKYFRPIFTGDYALPNVISKNSLGYNRLVECLDKLDKSDNEKSIAYELEMHIYLIRFFQTLYKYDYIISQSSATIKGGKAIKKAIQYIDENYSNSLCIGELADMCGFSQSHFMNLFKKHTGQSCINYINSVRINRAVDLLKHSDTSIIDVSEQVGFSSISYFNRIFKKITGITPKEVKKQE